jgi:hypothetical protein
MLTNLIISLKLLTHLRILILIKEANNDNVKVLRKKRETIVDLRRVS